MKLYEEQNLVFVFYFHVRQCPRYVIRQSPVYKQFYKIYLLKLLSKNVREKKLGSSTLVINTIQLDAVRRRADDILLQNLIADDDQHSGSVDIDHIDFSVPDVDDLDQDLELPNIVFDGPQDDH